MFRDLFEKPRQRILKIPPWVLLALTLFLTFSAAYFIYLKTEAERNARISLATSRAVTTLTDRIQVYINTLRHTRSFFTAEDQVPTRPEFERFVSGFDLKARYPGMQALGYAPRVDAGEVARYEAQVQQAGLENYQVWPEAEAEQVFPIQYIEPFDSRNERAVGFNMFSDPVRREAMERARDTGMAAVTEAVVLVQETNEDVQKGFLIFFPLYESGLPVATVEQRRQALRGFVMSAFRAKDLFGAVLAELNARGEALIFSVYSEGGATVEKALFSPGDREVPSRYRSSEIIYPLRFGGREWLVAVRPVDNAEFTGSFWFYGLILIFGTAVSMLIYVFAKTAEERASSLENSESQMRLIVNSIPLYLAYVDREERYLFHNSAAQAEVKSSEESNYGGRRMVEVLGIDLYSRVHSYVKKALSGESVSFETYAETAQGVRDLHVSYISDFRADGSVRGFIILVSDITERRHSERQLKDERRISETVSGVGLSLRAEMKFDDLVQKITDTATFLSNARFGAFFGDQVERPDREGYSLIAVSGAERAAFESFPTPTDTKLFEPLYSGRGSLRFDDLSQVPGFCKSVPTIEAMGREIPLRSYMAVPVVSRSGVIFGALLFAHPEPGVFTARSEKLIEGIAAQAGVAIDNAKLYHDAQTLNRMKDEFVATLSHELRTPLNVILGHAEVLKNEGRDFEELESSIDAIHRNATAQNQIISDLLDISAVVNGKLGFKPVRLIVGDIVESAISGLKTSAANHGISIEFKNEAPDLSIIGDATRIQQVVWNLLSNSIKFTPRDGTILVILSEAGDDCLLRVKDTGFGIESEFLPYIFDRFRQEDSSSTRSFGGLGLGLAIVRHLVELHGGSISAHSDGKGRGAEFLVRLPKKALELPLASSTPAELRASKTGKLISPAAPDISGIKLLAVDDDADARALLSLILTRAKAKFKICASAREALACLNSEAYDAIISDIGMPDKDGFTFMQELRSYETEKSSFTPAIALTAFAREEEAKRAFAAGYQVHLAKPVDTGALIGAIHGLVRH